MWTGRKSRRSWVPPAAENQPLLNLIAGITGDYDGQIRNRAGKTGYVFQEDRILPWLTVYDNIRVVRMIPMRRASCS